jgi:uncharacterized membrane protein YccC
MSLFRHTRRRFLIRASRVEFRLGIRLAMTAVLAMAAGEMLGVHAFYWAGISAIVVSTGSPGGSFRASLTRFGGTMVGLAVGALFVWLLGHRLVAVALAIPVAILICQLVGLKDSVKITALTTLFPITLAAAGHGFQVTLATATSRAENVLLGCLVTLLIDGLIWPERVTARLLGQVRLDIAWAGRLTSDLLQAYASGIEQPMNPPVLELQAGCLQYSKLLKEMGPAAEDRDVSRGMLETQVQGLRQMVDHCAALRDIQRRTGGDRVQQLLGKELGAVSSAIRETTGAVGRDEPTIATRLPALGAAVARLETAYEDIRGDKGTQTFSSQEVFRLLGVLYLCGAMARALSQLVPDQGSI